MRKLLCFLALTWQVQATTVTVTVSGPLSGTAFVNGNDVVVNTGVTLTQDITAIFGSSGTTETAMQINGTGKVLQNPGVTATFRGNITAAGTSTSVPAWHMLGTGSGCGMFQFDSSLTSPTSTAYSFTASSAGAWEFLQADGTAAHHCTVTSTTASSAAAGYFDGSGASQSGGIIATYTDFSNIGHIRSSFFANAMTTSVTNSTFINVGSIRQESLSTGSVLIWANNIHTATNGGYTFIPLTSVGTGITCLFANNSFDGLFGQDAGQGGDASGCTLRDNFFGGSIANLGAVNGNYTCNNNFITQPATVGMRLDCSMLSPNYASIGPSTNGPGPIAHTHTPDSGYAGNQQLILILDPNVFMPVSTIGNDGIVVPQSGAAHCYTVRNSITLDHPDLTGMNLLDMTDQTLTGNPACPSGISATGIGYDIQYSTISACAHSQQFLGGVAYENETNPSSSVLRGAFGNNIIACLDGTAAGFVYNASTENTSTDSLTIFPSGQFGMQQAPTPPACVSGQPCTNAANSYRGAWTVTPGASDVKADPQFVDPTRRAVTFPTQYLNITTQGPWSTFPSSHVFQVGDIVTNNNSAGWGGAFVIAYRCWTSHVKSTANSEPGSDWTGAATDWSYWEPEIYDVMRQNTATGTITDSSIGCGNGCSYPQALINWTVSGRVPRNPAMIGVASNGGAFGAASPYTLNLIQ